MGKLQRRRTVVQAVWTAASNSYLIGFLQGKLYKGPIKNLCVPGLNCYSCPGAVGSCPIGALQAVIGGRKFSFAFYVVGFLMLVGAFCGRFVCGWLCPFGWIQELLHKIPFPKKLRTFKLDKALRGLKYVILAVFVFLLPLLLTDAFGQGKPYFCMLVCPAGTLEAGIPMVALNASLQSAVGGLYFFKLFLLLAVIVLCLLIYRPFCKYLCPLGAIYALCNPVSLYRYEVNEKACTRCGACAAGCPMQVRPMDTPNALECIRCGKCKEICPEGAITSGVCPGGVRRMKGRNAQ